MDIEKVNVLILAGSRDFGRCKIASHVPVCLWPVLGRPVIEIAIRNLVNQGVKEIIICSEEKIGNFKTLAAEIPKIHLSFIEESLRAGTAGCLRDAIRGRNKDMTIVIPAAMISLPDIKDLLTAHLEQKADLTVVFNPGHENNELGTSTGIYVCGRKILDNIPEDGYCDIKEALIPEMVSKAMVIKAHRLSQNVNNFRDSKEYLCAMANFIEQGEFSDDKISFVSHDKGQLFLGNNAKVDPSVKIIGNVIVMDNARISNNTVIFGPAVIGQNSYIQNDNIIINSVIWDKVEIGSHCEISNSLLDNNVRINSNTNICDTEIAFERTAFLKRFAVQSAQLKSSVSDWRKSLKDSRREPVLSDFSYLGWAGLFAVIAAFMWSYWANIADLWNIWLSSDEYSSGILVPFLAAYVLWSRRDQLQNVPLKPAIIGLLIFFIAEGLRLFGVFFMFGSAERISVLIGTAALVMFLLGWKFFKKTATTLLFLCLMLPWPYRVQGAVTLPLQSWATSSAVFCLEILGYDVVKEGNLIHIGLSAVAVAEACNGLRMITAFFVISALVVMLAKRPLWQKIIVLISSLPIALLCNTARLVITSIAFTYVKGEHWEKMFHDFGGYAMVPLALAAVIAEFWLLQRLTEVPVEKKAIIIVRQ